MIMNKQKISNLIREAITALCRNGLDYNAGFAVEGMLQVLLDTREMFQIDINEVFGLTIDGLACLKRKMNITDTNGSSMEAGKNVLQVLGLLIPTDY